MSAELDLGAVPYDITAALAEEYAALELRYSIGDWEPAELNGGRFAEAVLRYLEWKRDGTFTPIGTQLDRSKIISLVDRDPSLPEGVRFHVRRAIELVLDVRNKRDVAHLGAVVDVNEMDSELVMRLASWSLSEIIREESGLTPAEIQHLIDRLSTVRLPLVEEVDGEIIVVATNLDHARRALVALYHVFPDGLDLTALRKATGHGHATRFRGLLQEHEETARLIIRGKIARLTKKGVQWIEANIPMRLDIGT